MEKKTTEEMRVAVLAECKTLCPNDEDTFGVVINGLDCTITGRHHHGIADFDIRETGFFKRRIYQIRSSDDGNWWHLYYIFLGLSERDAVADERLQTDFWERKFNEECEAHIISIEQYQAKNAALVEVLGEVKRYCESGNRGGATRLPASDKFRAEGMYQEVIEAIEANGKGGINA